MTIKKYWLNDPLLLQAQAVKERIVQIPYYVVDDFLSKDELNSVVDKLSKYDQRLLDSKVLDTSDNSQWIQLQDYFDNYIVERCLQVNSEIFNLNIDSCLYPKYAVYKEARDTDWYVDGPFSVKNKLSSDVVWRKLSASIELSNEEYEGGELDIVIAGSRPETCYHSIKLAPGSAVFFPAFLMHRIKKITKGTRKSLIYGFCGPRWQ